MSLAVAFAAVAVYANSLGNAFVNDDVSAIRDNGAVQRLDLRQIFLTSSWWGGVAIGYRPLVTLSFALNYALGAQHPLGYHVVNILLHAAVSLLLFGLTCRVAGRAGPACVAGLLFATHPLATEAVATIVGRAELMAALFVLLALWVDVGGYARPAGRLASGAAMAAAFACGLLSKENAVTLIPLLLVSDLMVRCRGRWSEFLSGLRGARGGLYLALVLVLGGYLLVRFSIEGTLAPKFGLAMNPLAGVSTPVRLLNAVVIAGRYAWLLVAPLRLSADYMIGALPVIDDVSDWRVIVSAIGLVAAGTAAVALRHRQPVITWGLLFLACAYSLISNLALPIQAMMAERWMYLPLAGFCVAVAFSAAAALDSVAAVRRSVLAIVLTVVVVGTYGVRTMLRNRDWRDAFSIWSATVKVAPGSVKARDGLAGEYVWAGRFQEAIDLLEESVRKYPGNPMSYQLLGDAYSQLDRADKAIENYKKTVAIIPGAIDVRRQLGILSLRQGAVVDAVDQLKAVKEARPDLAQSWLDLGKAHYIERRTVKAREEFLAALARDPTLAEAHAGLAACDHVDGDFDGAAREYLKALSLGDPPTGNLRQAVEGAVTLLAPRGPTSAAAAAAYASEALRYFPDSAVLRQLAGSPPE